MLGFQRDWQSRPVLDSEADDHRCPRADNTTGTSGHLGNRIGPEMLDNLVKRAGHWRQAASRSSMASRARQASRIEDGIAVAIEAGRDARLPSLSVKGS